MAELILEILRLYLAKNTEEHLVTRKARTEDQDRIGLTASQVAEFFLKLEERLKKRARDLLKALWMRGISSQHIKS